MVRIWTWLAAFNALPAALALPQERAAWPDTPFTVSGRNIVSASGRNIVYAGVNWPGAADTMLPEGLQYNSIENIVGFIKSLGMNVVRLTYAIEMIDDIYSNSPDQTLQGTLTKALGSSAGASVLQKILRNNPQFTAQTTRLQVFDAVAKALANQQIWIHLDNHVSKAQWCCSQNDGNAWFGDTYFNVNNWNRGLGYMANHVKAWTGLASMSLRNELRQPTDNAGLPYTWNTWISEVIPAASVIHGNNSAPLIFFSGQGYDTDDTYFIQRQTWNGQTFTPSTYTFQNKIVYEIHNYQNSATNCNQIQPGLYNAAYCAMNLSDNACPNHGPVVMSEFGFDQTDGSVGGAYAQCIKSILISQPGGPGGWMQWTLSGSYYIRSGAQDADDTWGELTASFGDSDPANRLCSGLLDHTWSGWRNQTVINQYVTPLVKATA